MSKKEAWAIKTKRGNFVNNPSALHWEANRTMLFRTQKEARMWLENDVYWKPLAKVVKVYLIVKEVGL